MRRRVEQYSPFPATPSFRTLAEAVKSVEADAALIVVPPEYHAEVAIEALQHGLHCLVEKPLASTILQAVSIVEAATLAGKKLMVSQNYRFKQAPQTVRKLINERCIGEIGSTFINFQKSPIFSGFRLEMAEPLITDMAIHHFDQIRGLLGLEPISVRAASWNPGWSGFKGNAAATAWFETATGTFICYTGSWVSRGWQTTWDGDWRIQGAGGEIHWFDNEVQVLPLDVTRTTFMKNAVEKSGVLHVKLIDLIAEDRWACLLEFAAAIRENRAPQTSGEDNLKSMAMVIGARLAAESGGTIQLSDILS